MAGATTNKKGAVKPAAKPGKASKAADKPARQAAPLAAAPETAQGGRAVKAAARARVPFPKKNQPPSEAEFVARLPLATGKKFENVRTFLKKQAGVTEDLYFYGPKTGWAYRYSHGASSLGTIMIHDDHLMGIVALDAAALGEVDFTALSDVGERARRLAHGSPSLSWLDLPLDGPGASDFKVLLKAKLRTLPELDADPGPGAAPMATPATMTTMTTMTTKTTRTNGGPGAVAPANPAAPSRAPGPPPPPQPRGRKARAT